MADPNLTNWQNATDNQFEFGKNAYLEAIPDLADASSAAMGASNLQGGGATRQGNLAGGLTSRISTFNGLQDQYATGAFGANSPERQQQVSDQASASVATNADNLRQQGVRQMERKGINPGSGAAMALNTQFGINQASAQAGAANKARQDLEVVANDRQKTAIGFGANLASQATNADQVSGIMADRAVASALAPVKNKLDFAGGISGIYDKAVGGYKGLWTSQNLSADQQAVLNAADSRASASDNAALLGALGSYASSAGGASTIASVASGIGSGISSAWDYLTGW